MNIKFPNYLIMERLTDKRTAQQVRENIEKLQAKGFEVSISDLRYIKLADYENKEENAMNVNGHWYTETEIEAYVVTMEHKLATLEDKHLSECRQISEYDRENKALKELLTQVRAYYGEKESWVDLYEEKYKELMKNG